MISYINRLAGVFSLKHANLTKSPVSNPYHCVTIQYQSDMACEAIRKLEPKSRLSEQAPLLTETKLRYLPNEAPLLPLAGCNMAYCRCRYVHYEDRRERDRRNDGGHSIVGFRDRDRRAGQDRRGFQGVRKRLAHQR